tara:strand:+ start:35 stop:736 length:702 start_codon:yes stop_codon:yes gene_type:complete
MALPKINEVPKYFLEIPSTEKKLAYRPFLTKEQKILLIAMESQNQENILGAITDIIQTCVLEDIDIKQLTTFDVEYLFTQIRSKSVGETSKIGMKCSECETANEISINLEEIKVNKDNVPSNIIKLNDKYTIKLKYPNYLFTLKTTADSFTENMILLIVGCLDALMTEEEHISFKDETEADILDFIDSLTTTQFEEVLTFANGIPKLEHKVEFVCENCQHQNHGTLRGINDFF